MSEMRKDGVNRKIAITKTEESLDIRQLVSEDREMENQQKMSVVLAGEARCPMGWTEMGEKKVICLRRMHSTNRHRQDN